MSPPGLLLLHVSVLPQHTTLPACHTHTACLSMLPQARNLEYLQASLDMQCGMCGRV